MNVFALDSHSKYHHVVTPYPYLHASPRNIKATQVETSIRPNPFPVQVAGKNLLLNFFRVDSLLRNIFVKPINL